MKSIKEFLSESFKPRDKVRMIDKLDVTHLTAFPGRTGRDAFGIGGTVLKSHEEFTERRSRYLLRIGTSVCALVGGALLGQDVRQRRTDRGIAADDRRRRITREDEDRSRAQAIQELGLRDQFGLEFAPGGPDIPNLPQLSGAQIPGVTALREGVGQQLAPEGFAGVPVGFRKVGPSAAEVATGEEAEQNRLVGARLSLGGDTVSGDEVAALRAAGLLDEMAGEVGFGTPPVAPLADRRDEARFLASSRAQGTAEGTDLGTPAPPSLEVRAEEERIMAQARAEGTAAGQGNAVSAPVTPQEQALFDSFDLSPEMNEFVQAMEGSERRAFILDRTKRPTATEQERRAATVLPRASVGYDVILDLVDEFGGGPGLQVMFGTGLGRFAQREQVQRYNAAGAAIASAFLRVESGAAITVAEAEDMMRTMLPQPGDKDGTVALKLEMLQAQMGALQNAASLVPGVETQFLTRKEVKDALTDAEIDQMIADGASDEDIAAEIARRRGS